jgi:large subunit ribosomal protein L3
MSKISKPRRGSLGFLPEKRAVKPYPSVSTWPESKEAKLLGFAGYKAGMTRVFAIDQQKTSPSFSQEIAIPVTIVECPPLTVKEVRAYETTSQGLKLIPKKRVDEKKADIKEVRIVVQTKPPHKKKTESFELGVGGTPEQALAYANSILNKELKLNEIFKEGDYIDVIAITKGKGIQGVIKRWGARIQSRKAKGKRRHIGTINPWTPSRTMWTTLMAGQMGYHRRTFLNSRVLKVGDDGKAVTKKGGIPHYGIIKSNYAILKGSIPGPNKRLVLMRFSIRPPKQKEMPEIMEVAI